MLRRLTSRLAIFIASLLAASFVVFTICQALPGDVARVILGTNATPDQMAALRTKLGLDRPFFVRYGEWLVQLVTGNFGKSYYTGYSASYVISPKLGVTLWLVLLAMIIAVVLALPMGMAAALKRRHWQGFMLSSLSQVGMAIPAFFLGILLVIVFAVILRWLPPNGYVPLARDPWQWLRHLVLPALSLGIVQAAVLSRYVRSAILEVLAEDYFRTARAFGWRVWPALFRHGLRNAALSLVTVLGLQLSTLLVGAIVIEQVFALPGLGQLLLTSVSTHDLGIVQAIVMLLVFAVLSINMIVDVLYLIIDPRLRVREAAK